MTTDILDQTTPAAGCNVENIPQIQPSDGLAVAAPPSLLEDEQDSDETSDAVSIASTIKCNHEPFDTLQYKVKDLVLQLWPDLEPSDVKIEPMKGGDYHRIINITIFEPYHMLSFIPFKSMRDFLLQCFVPRDRNRRVADRYILRIPRLQTDNASMIYELTTLQYMKRCFPTPSAIPEVIVHDSSCDNALGTPYMLQRRLRGTPLVDIWPTLNRQQKKCAVRHIAYFIATLNQRHSACAGVISPTNRIADLDRPKLEQMPVPRPLTRMPPGLSLSEPSPAVPQTTRAFLLSLCERQRQWAQDAGEPVFNNLWDGFVDMIERLHGMGFLPDDDAFYFSHSAFEPSNFLAEVLSDSTIHISGILDWELAGFAPGFVSARPPFWLWNGEGEDEEDAALELREGSEDADLKRVYERAVGRKLGDWDKMEYFLARKMYGCLTRGILSGEDDVRAKGVLEAFEKLHPVPL